MIKDACIETVKDTVVIHEVIAALGVELKQHGGNWQGCCPFHNEKTPSFVVSPQKHIYKCFGCGESGDAIKFVMDYKRIDYPDAIRLLAEQYNIALEETEPENAEDKEKRISQGEVLKMAQQMYHAALMAIPETEEASVRGYLKHLRHFTEEDIRDWGMGWAPEGGKFLTKKMIDSGNWQPAYELKLVKSKNDFNYDLFQRRWMLPIHNFRGEIVGFAGRILPDEEQQKKSAKYINSEDSAKFKKSNLLFGLYQALLQNAFRNFGYAVLVEGYTDVIGMHKRGMHNTVASCGTSITLEQFKLLRKYTGEVVFMQDGDGAGTKSMLTGINNALHAGLAVKVVPLPAGDDPDSLCRRAEDDKQIQDYVQQGMLDAVIWKAWHLMNVAQDDSFKREEAFTEIGKMIAAIDSEFKREDYIAKIGKQKMGIKATLLATYVKKLQADKEQEHKKYEKSDGQDYSEYPEWVNSKDQLDMIGQYGIVENPKNNTTWFAGSGDSLERKANFTLRCLYLLERANNTPLRIFELKNIKNYKKLISMNMEAINSLTQFNVQINSLGNFLFDGGIAHLNRWKHVLFEQETTIKEVDTLGWYAEGGFWAMANGIFYGGNWHPVNDEGIVEKDGRRYLIRADSNIEFEGKQGYEHEKKFRHKPTEVNFKGWGLMMRDVYDEHNIIGMSWFCASLFRDIIFSRFTVFPHLNMSGPPGSGKSQLAETFSMMFGEPQEKVNLNAVTKVAFQRKLAQFNNYPLWCDEYLNGINPALVQGLKGAYDGSGYEKGMKTTDNASITTKVNSALMISGQHLPNADPALFTRILLLQFRVKETWNVKAYDDLKRAEKEGLTNVTFEILQHRQLIEDKFNDAFDKALSDARQELGRKHGGIKLDDRIMKNYLIPMTVFRILDKVLMFPFSEAEAWAVFTKRMLEHAQLISSGADVAMFWDIVGTLFKNEDIKAGIDFDLRHEPIDGIMTKVLALRLETVHGEYAKEFKKAKGNTENVLDKNTMAYYLRASDEEFVRYSDTHRYSTKVVTSAYIFNYEELQRKYKLVLWDANAIEEKVDEKTEAEKEKEIIQAELEY